ncbi:MAG: VOC family protein [Betaproteobacteria bacterium]|nr:MAG: VOC family protein [Betaproteobacteria bacterium]
MKIDSLDHVVLTCADVEATIGFYTKVLGMEAVSFGEGRRALRFGSSKINLHQQGKEYVLDAQHAIPGSADLCFITSMPIQEVIDHLADCDVAIIHGPVPQTGATAPLRSVYFRDPDQNLIEVANLMSG